MNLTHTLELFDTPKAARVDCPISAHIRGRVFYEGTYWPARFYDGLVDANYALAVSSRVLVVGRQGLTLLVSPLLAAACA
ncbi:NfeD family protein [Nodosilinea sp. LEGE 07088]|uniref:NfeD family protein n=1 Tax=Nodosilinea sp. LEGE 07088 TaxID=2777968 RepID=UPI0018803EEB|nr:NfeD family protein [Nodosilinea sp. LEGE 07088]MBE9136072.1 NfeD family protein [Nodosilinea sp. LEGE 07088]